MSTDHDWTYALEAVERSGLISITRRCRRCPSFQRLTRIALTLTADGRLDLPAAFEGMDDRAGACTTHHEGA